MLLIYIRSSLLSNNLNMLNRLIQTIVQSQIIINVMCTTCNEVVNIYGRLNTLWLRQNGRHFPDDIFKCISLNENVCISIKISLKFVPGGPNHNFQPLVQMAWRRPGDKPLSELMMVSLLTHICVTRPQWVKAKSLVAQEHPFHTYLAGAKCVSDERGMGCCKTPI